ncbi:hydrogen peroxide-inducible genes activator [Membranihabitans marinus]|uniref:hydrogen peroxide-inducible genes activator n=1 Tax=Membranihabitans marinus TaxID=1227546 RepID=UPI001F1C61F8|nr:hydrogen peroxide-inducible genes activator [Membranihabitans marinus]
MFSFAQLEYVIALHTYGNFQLAADKCFVTQPTLSMQIKKLERDLNIILFDRSKKPVKPTDIGLAFIQQARIILSERDHLHDVLDSFQNKIEGVLELGIIPSVSPYLLPLFIVEFNKKFPKLVINVHEMMTMQLIEALKKETIDAAILVTPIHDDQIECDALYYEEIAVYVSENHEFMDLEKIPQKDLNRNDIWTLKTGHCFRDQTLNLCGRDSFHSEHRQFTFESGAIETLIKMVDLQGGFTLIPELLIGNIQPEHRNRVKWIAGDAPVREVSVATYRNYAKKRLIEYLRNEIRKSLPDFMLKKNRGKVVEWM